MKFLFKDEHSEQEYYRLYNKSLQLFDVPFEERVVETSYGLTHIIIFGDQTKKPLLMLHGMAMSSTMWYPNVKHLIAERCVITIDTIGDFGKSRASSIITHTESVNDWLNQVMDKLMISKCDLLGHSMGGFISIIYTLMNPNRVSKLILYAPAAAFYRINPLYFAIVFPAILFHSKRLTEWAFSWLSGKNNSINPTFNDQILAAFKTGKPLFRLIPSVFHVDTFRNFKHQTLLMIGDKEVLYPYRKAIINAQRLIPHLEQYVIAGAGHLLSMDSATIVNEITINFLKDK